MDFFSEQDRAYRNTRKLLLLFVSAVLLIVLVIYVAVSALFFSIGVTEEPIPFWELQRLAVVGGVTITLILGATLHKVAILALGGGGGVAESLGGRRIQRETENFHERRLINVVDEIAIASGLPVPDLYLLEAEWGINAFAAGFKPSEAVIAVTRGALERLSRDELQGVVAHEFSHILNGDMRLNLRLVGILHGILILAIIGREIMQGAGRSRNGGRLALFGLALLAIGYVGVFFGHLIKAAVSRQREFLADASAVQFTRNPDGIAGALKKIAGVAGSHLITPRAEEASHMFFGEGLSIAGLWATHPPIAERIRRLDPAFNPALLREMAQGAPSEEGLAALSNAGSMKLDPERFSQSVGRVVEPHVEYARALLARLPEGLREDLRKPGCAKAIVYALLADRSDAIVQQQEAIVAAEESEGAAHRMMLHLKWVREAGPAVRLPLVDLALPALAELNPEERQGFVTVVEKLSRVDQRVDLFEYTLRHILLRRLELKPRPRPQRRREILEIRDECALLFSLLAHAGARSEESALKAFHSATRLAPLEGPWQLATRESSSLKRLDLALAHLERLPARFKRRLVEACAAAVSTDGVVTVMEGELLRAVCEILECPVPPLLPGIDLRGAAV